MKRWISGRLTPLPDEIRVDLAKSFLSSLPQAASISLTSSLGAAVLAYRSKALLDLDLAMLLALIGVYRVAILIVYRRVDTPITTIKSALWWQRLQAGGLIGQAALLGALSFNAFTMAIPRRRFSPWALSCHSAAELCSPLCRSVGPDRYQSAIAGSHDCRRVVAFGASDFRGRSVPDRIRSRYGGGNAVST